MDRSTNAVSDKFPDHTVAVTLDVLLNRPRNIHDTVPADSLGDADVKRLFSHLQQTLGGHSAPSNWNRPSRISDKTIVTHAHVQAHDVTKFNATVTSQPMNHFLIHGKTDVTRILSIPEKSALGSSFLHCLGGEIINLLRRYTRPNEV